MLLLVVPLAPLIPFILPLPPLYKYFFTISLSSLFCMLFQRMLIRMSLFRFFIAGIVIGVMAFHSAKGSNLSVPSLLGDDDVVGGGSSGVVSSYAYNVTSVLFLITIMSVVGTAFTIPHMFANARILKMEVYAGLHTTLSTWLMLLSVDMPLFLAAAIVLGGLVWLLLGFTGSCTLFLGTVVLTTLSGYTLALACSILCDSVEKALFWFALWGVINIIFTGYLQPIPLFPGKISSFNS